MADNREGQSCWTGPLKVLGILGLCLVSGVIGGVANNFFGASAYQMSYVDFISIMLTAIAVLMTVLAIFLAILGVVGWNSVTAKVNQRTGQILDDGFKEGKPLHAMMRKQINDAMYSGITLASAQNEAEDTIDNDGEERQGNEQ